MIAALPSRNPFADPVLPTFADLIDRIAADTVLPLRQRRNWIWALRVIARAAGKAQAQIPAHPAYLRPIFKTSAPASLSITKAAWNNARSLAGKALEWAGVASMPGRYQAAFAPEWADLWQLLPTGTNAMRCRLSRLLHFCSAQGIHPAQVNDEVLAVFHDALITESIVEQPYTIYHGAAKSWNNASEQIIGWPQQRVTVPSRRQIFSLPWEAFPATLSTDVETYLRRATGLDLTDDHFTRAQRPATINTRRSQLRFFATAIVKSGFPPDMLTDLRAMLAPEVAARGLQYLVERNAGASSVHISNLADFLPTLAGRLDMPAEVVSKLHLMQKKLKIVRHGMTSRNREVLREFDDPTTVRALVNLPARIWIEVRKGGRRGYREAKLIQTALAIGLLLNAPVRIRNLASIEVDRHLIQAGGPDGQSVHLRFPAHEVKNANEQEFPLLPALIEMLDAYLREWRPLLGDETSVFLFPGKKVGKHKGTGPLSAQIKRLVHAYTRLDMPSHRFRHADGKIYLDRNPGQYEVVRLLLGHKDSKTTTSFYTGAESASAARHYAETIRQIQEASYPSEPKRKRRA
jgi:integrase